MKTSSLRAMVMLFAALSCSPRRAVEAEYNVVPLPDEIELDAGKTFHFSPKTCVVASDSAQLVNAGLFADYVKTMTGFRPEITEDAPAENYIRLVADRQMPQAESYRINVNSDSVVVCGADPAGTFYGLQTLRKAIRGSKGEDVLYPAAVIKGSPLFSYRGALLDCARHFFPVDSVKIWIDMLALHNINTFHWHLTDDQGWRIEIKSRPKLTEIGSERPCTIIGTTEEYDSIPHCGYYSQEQVRDIVAYAAARHISVVPEIDLPGHMLAALASYPQLGCTGGPYEVMCRWGGSADILCAGSDSVYAFINDVLDEVVELFPSEYVHLGGDEAHYDQWEKCPKCQRKIRELGLESDGRSSEEQKLQNYVMQYAADRLVSKGRKIIGWDEVIGNGADKSTVVMGWRGPHGGYDGARMGYKVIKASNWYLYLDYKEDWDDVVGPPYGRVTPLDSTYNYTPVLPDYTPDQAADVIGVQCCLWTEYLPTFKDVEGKALPRMAAVSELQWCDAPKDFEGFRHRLEGLLKIYEAEGYDYRPL